MATATFGALVGAGTLGQIIVNGFSVQDYDEMYAGVVIVAVLCVSVDLALAGVQRLVGHGSGRAARLARRPTAGLTTAADEAIDRADSDAERESAPAGSVGGSG